MVKMRTAVARARVGQIGFVQDVQHLGQPAVYVVMVAVSVFVDMFMVVAMFSLVVVAAMPMEVRMSILVMMVVVLVMVVLMHIVGVAALLPPRRTGKAISWSWFSCSASSTTLKSQASSPAFSLG